MNLLALYLSILLCAVMQQPMQAPALNEIKAYVSKIDSDKSLLISRYSTTYGHPMEPGRDSIFWAYPTDFKSSAILYYSAGKLVKIKEIARYHRDFCENTYYLKNSRLVFVAERQVYCSYAQQGNIWLKNAPVCNSEKDCFFRGGYYFKNDSCIAKQERGEMQSAPEGSTIYKPGKLSTFFSWQAARYIAAFGKAPARKK